MDQPKPDEPLQFDQLKKFKTLLSSNLFDPERLSEVAMSIQKHFRRPVIKNINSMVNLKADTELMESFRTMEDGDAKITLSLFIPIARVENSQCAKYTGFSALSRALIGTEALVYELIIIASLYCCQNKPEIKQLMRDIGMTISFEEELRRCLSGKTSHVTLYALSRVLRCPIHHWTLCDDFTEGVKKISYYPLVPPNPQILERIELLEMFCESTSQFCLLIAKKTPAPSPAIFEAFTKSSNCAKERQKVDVTDQGVSGLDHSDSEEVKSRICYHGDRIGSLTQEQEHVNFYLTEKEEKDVIPSPRMTHGFSAKSIDEGGEFNEKSHVPESYSDDSDEVMVDVKKKERAKKDKKKKRSHSRCQSQSQPKRPVDETDKLQSSASALKVKTFKNSDKKRAKDAIRKDDWRREDRKRRHSCLLCDGEKNGKEYASSETLRFHLKSDKHNVCNTALKADYFRNMLRGDTDSEASNQE